MIVYVYDNQNKIIAIVKDVVYANDTDVIGVDSAVRGNTLDVIGIDAELTIPLGDGTDVALAVDDTIVLTGLVDLLPKFKALKELEQLDLEVPRIIEDVVEQGSFVLHESKSAIIARKQYLRTFIGGL